LAAELVGGFEEYDWVAVREQVTVMGVVVDIAQKIVFDEDEDIAAVDVEGADH
jgi:hypothetical protein